MEDGLSRLHYGAKECRGTKRPRSVQSRDKCRLRKAIDRGVDQEMENS